MSTLTITITSRFSGELNPLINAFSMPAKAMPDEDARLELLDWLFKNLNRVDHGSKHLIDIVEIPMPSMTAGDEVALSWVNGQVEELAVYSCQPSGWELFLASTHPSSRK